MTCYHPLKGYRRADGAICFHSKVGALAPPVVVACGQCSGCRRDRACHWATRCMHEASLWPLNSYVTLTYKDAPPSLQYIDYQLFMRRLRLARPKTRVRFFMCGEYGGENGRPHFHAILFNCDFGDKQYFKTEAGHKLYRSEELNALWSLGHCLVGGVSFQSAAYVARYCMEKRTGSLATLHYADKETGEMREPEFCHMSLKPGIGALWLDKFGKEVYSPGREGSVVINGVERNAPKYYDRRFQKLDEVRYDAMVYRRRLMRYDKMGEHTASRLAVKETVADASDEFFSKRDL